METYANKGGDSGVVGYEIGPGSIIVVFKDGWKYLYDANQPGEPLVSQMQQLARSGQGLNSFITRIVKKRFSSKSSR